ncbi:hypothetical protein M0805_009711 [Coniferiporia weirii]|nr:hypothetical protein M0805_009711 [Coniferiporia weirii]
MSTNVPINTPGVAAPTPQNTPLVNAPIAAGLSRPTVPDIQEAAEGADDDEVEDPLAALSVEQKRSLAGLLGVQVKQTELQNQFKREVWELEKKYLELTKPLYERRNALISGAAPPTSEEIAAGEAQAAKDDEDHTPLPVGDESAPIPEFWLTALRNHIGISELITDRDAAALRHLTDIRLAYLTEGEQPGFRLSFHFTQNEFFEDEVLEKTYFYKPEIDYSGDFVYDRARGTEIRWKEEKDLTKEFEVKKQRNKNTNRVRLVRKAHPAESFFNFFNPPEPPAEDDEEIDEDDIEDLEGRLELDYQIGEDIKERIIPHAVDYFTGKALEFDADELDDDDFDDDDDDDDDDFEDEDSDDDAPTERPVGKKGGAGGKKAEAPEECKQQ